MIQVYALVDAPPRKGPRRGPSGERVRFIEVGGFYVALGKGDSPELTKENLLARDRFVRELADEVAAILPARWGSHGASDADIAEDLLPRARAIKEALELVRGGEQMTLRFATAKARKKPGRPRTGTAYLEARARAAEEARSTPELEAFRSQLGLVRAERVERREGAASVYHLIERGRSEEWLAVFSGTAFRASGPFPPYAFAPELP
ncbi:MAG TPA: GvpL/GvpF family gas vesicle protein [Planctomycetota bacterium]|nr:GvpL/GvpF family gas vesicle protein [Planctomycetota bacterium]